jgi:hypothetical protein
MALCVIIGISAYLLLLRPKRTFSQLRPNGFMPDAALVRPGPASSPNGSTRIPRTSVNWRPDARIIARRGRPQPIQNNLRPGFPAAAWGADDFRPEPKKPPREFQTRELFSSARTRPGEPPAAIIEGARAIAVANCAAIEAAAAVIDAGGIPARDRAAGEGAARVIE